MVLRLWSRGGQKRAAVRGFELTRIEAVQVDGDLQTSFLRQARQLNENRAHGPEALFSPHGDDPDGEKAAVLQQLKGELTPLEGLPRCGMLLGLHGTSHANANNLFRGGFAQINFDDNGTPNLYRRPLCRTMPMSRPHVPWYTQATLARASTSRRTPSTRASTRAAPTVATGRPTPRASTCSWRAGPPWA